jgi:hypothetical protein
VQARAPGHETLAVNPADIAQAEAAHTARAAALCTSVKATTGSCGAKTAVHSNLRIAVQHHEVLDVRGTSWGE